MVLAARAFVVKSPLTIIGGIVSLFLFGITAVVILAVAGNGLTDNARLIVITSIFTALSAAVPSLLSLYKTEATQHDIRNGVVKDKVKEAIVEVAEDTDSDGIYFKTAREGDGDHG